MYTYDFRYIVPVPQRGQHIAFCWASGCWYVGEVVGDINESSASVRIGIYEDEPERLATIGFDNMRHLAQEDTNKPIGTTLQLP